MSMTYSITLGTGATADDISADVLGLRWSRGFRRAYDSVASPAELRITVENRDQKFSPAVAGALDLAPDRAVTVSASDGVDIWTLFTGVIHHVEPEAGTFGARQAVIVARDALAMLAEVRISLPLQVLVRADSVLDTIFDMSPLDAYTRDFETGVSVLAYVGDLWGDGVSAITAIRQIVEAERGRFYVDRDGTLVMLNRHHTLRSQAVILTLTDTAEAMTVAYGADMVNRVRVRVRPRDVGAVQADVWVLDSPQMVRPGADGERVLTVRFRDTNGFPIGATNVMSPVKTTDYSANTQSDGSGTNITAQFDMTLLSVEGSSARVTLRNNTADTAYLLAGARLRGTPLLRGDDVTVEQADDASISAYGERAMTLTLFALSAVEDADQTARFELNRRKDPQTRVESVTVDVRLDVALDVSLFDRVQIIETQTGDDAVYQVIAEAHEVTQGGAVHRVTWTLEPAEALRYWALNYSKLETETRVGY